MVTHKLKKIQFISLLLIILVLAACGGNTTKPLSDKQLLINALVSQDNPTANQYKSTIKNKTIELDLYTAILGGEKVITTIDGKKVKLKIKAETQNGTKVKLKGKGFTKYKKEGQFGDLYITYSIKIPTELNAKEKGLLKELQKIRL